MNDLNAGFGLSESGAATADRRNDAQAKDAAALGQGKDRLMSDLKTVITDAQALLKDAVKLSTESVPAYLEDKARALKDNVQHARASVEERAKNATVATETYVKENPWKALAYVAVTSALVSFLLVRAVGFDSDVRPWRKS
jgi:ElaB/YqjD/DUF883 family membrane-anchored ribosome-binding protein